MKCIEKDKSNILTEWIDLKSINRRIIAFTYYYRFISLIEGLRKELGNEGHEFKELVSYYIFNNKIKELKWCGTSYYYNMKLRKNNENLFRATSDIQEDNKKFERIKKCVPLTIEALQEIFEDELTTHEDKSKIIRILNNGIKPESTLLQTLVALAVGQVNGSETSLPSYSKSLGVALYKYAHGKCSLIIKKQADLNVVKLGKDSMCTFYEMNNIPTTTLKNVDFSIDFSTARDESMKNLNRWLCDLFTDEKSICSHGTPILDRHVVNTFPIIDDETLELSNIEFIFLLRVYRNMVNSKEMSPMLENYFIDIKQDILAQISGMISAMNESEIVKQGNPEWREAIENINKIVEQIERLDEEVLEYIKHKISFLDCIDWTKEKVYFMKFMENKEEARFFYKTERRSNEPLVWLIIKYTLLKLQEDKKIQRGEV